jgi:phospholipid/cholesterol/gamma-HCH transport system substrate-binding protein
LGINRICRNDFFIGKQKNMFESLFRIKLISKWLECLIEEQCSFSGINIGTVDEIQLVSDSAVVVSLTIEKDVQNLLRRMLQQSIGSDGLMGDKF